MQQQPKRKHVTTACISCREGKVKCDGASPACRNCMNKGKECRYQAGEDKRKLSLRVAIELLSARVNELCQYIESNGLRIPSMAPDDEKTLKRVLETLGLAHVESSLEQQWNGSQPEAISQQRTPLYGPSSSSAQFNRQDTTVVRNEPVQENLTRDIQQGSRTAREEPISAPPSVGSGPARSVETLHDGSKENDVPPASHQSIISTDVINADPSRWNWSTGQGSGIEVPMTFTESAPDVGQVADDANNDIHKTPDHTALGSVDGQSLREKSSSDSDLMEEELVERLSDTMGTLHIGPNGQIRYYGATSNFNLIEPPAPDNLTVHRTVRDNGDQYLELLGLSKEVPPDIEEHLINLYFAWQDPSFHVVDRAMYLDAKVKWMDQKEDTPYYSEALRNSMCCLGAAFETRYHPTFVTFPKSLADFFGDRTKALLEIELDCPNVATVQAMVVLSAHDIGCKRDARGWLYSGMAIRLAFDLALHVDVSRFVANGAIGAAEAELRRTVFWGAYTVDNLWGYYLGRPFRINTEDVTVGKPGDGLNPSQPGQWFPYVSANAMEMYTPLVDRTEEISRERVTMAEIMAPLGHVLYGSQKMTRKALQELNARTTKELMDWKANLPPVLQVDLSDHATPHLPHLLLLHMQYHQNMIHAHRPWMSKSYIQPQPPQGPDYSHARQVCVESAIAIAKLLYLYEIRYTLRRMNIQGVAVTCSAALFLTFANISRHQGHSEETTAMYLSICFRALDEFGPSWESAKRVREYLVRLKRDWENRARSNQQSLSPSPSRRLHTSASNSASQVSRKRTRLSSDVESGISGGFQEASFPQQQMYGNQRDVDTELGLDLDWMLAWNTQAAGVDWANGMYSIPMSSFLHPPNMQT